MESGDNTASAELDEHMDYPPHQKCVELGVDFGTGLGAANTAVFGSDLTGEFADLIAGNTRDTRPIEFKLFTILTVVDVVRVRIVYPIPVGIVVEAGNVIAIISAPVRWTRRTGVQLFAELRTLAYACIIAIALVCFTILFSICLSSNLFSIIFGHIWK